MVQEIKMAFTNPQINSYGLGRNYQLKIPCNDAFFPQIECFEKFIREIDRMITIYQDSPLGIGIISRSNTQKEYKCYNLITLSPSYFDPIYEEFVKYWVVGGKSINIMPQFEDYEIDIQRKINLVNNTILSFYESVKIINPSFMVKQGLFVNFEDIINQGLTRSDIEQILLILSKSAGFLFYLSRFPTVKIIPWLPLNFQSVMDSLGDFRKELEKQIPNIDDRGMPKSKSPLVQFQIPPGTGWKKDVTIKFISNDDLEIKVGTQLKKFHYAEIGFKKHSEKFAAKQSWGIFRILAGRKELPIYPKDVTKSRSLNQKSIQEINKILKEIIPITDDDNPIIAQKGVYIAKFTLISNENVPDEVDPFAYRKYKQTRKPYSKSNLESESEIDTNLDQNEI